MIEIARNRNIFRQMIMYHKVYLKQLFINCVIHNGYHSEPQVRSGVHEMNLGNDYHSSPVPYWAY